MQRWHISRPLFSKACHSVAFAVSLLVMPLDFSAQSGRIDALRKALQREGIDAFLVPRVDEHRGEYVPPGAERLQWLTGFSGSAGQAVILADKAALFVDGRYTLQASKEASGALYDILQTPEHTAEGYLEAALGDGQALGYDPWLHSLAERRRLQALTQRCGARLVALTENPLDRVWSDRPAPPRAPANPHPLEFAGEDSLSKRRRLAVGLESRGCAAVVLSLPDSIAWLLNVRGQDVARTPFVLSFAILRRSGDVDWFVHKDKITTAVTETLDEGVQVRSPETLGAALDELGGSKVLLEASSIPAWIAARLESAGAELLEGDDPCQAPKAAKNEAEQQGARNAHKRDGAALTRFLAWFHRESSQGAVQELSCSNHLEALRRQNNHFRDLSFDTIAGSGPNGAIVHYRVTEESDRTIGSGELMVLDSGGQYLDGTTDVTRTLVVGTPGAEERDRYTRVLQGHIALASVRFPPGTSGSQLDVLARRPLWSAGLDYDHGTGHGVGSFLSVHEGPQRISKLPNRVALEPGMIVSNEPGYYKTGAYGIRIENLVMVIESPAEEGEERPMLAFETLTLAPLERRLIETALLSAEEIAWVDGYHARVQETLGAALEGEDRAFLEEACRPLDT